MKLSLSAVACTSVAVSLGITIGFIAGGLGLEGNEWITAKNVYIPETGVDSKGNPTFFFTLGPVSANLLPVIMILNLLY